MNSLGTIQRVANSKRPPIIYYYTNVSSSSRSFITSNEQTVSNITDVSFLYMNGVWRHSASQDNSNAYVITDVSSTTYVENGVYSGGTNASIRGYYTGNVTTVVGGSTISGEWVQVELPYDLYLRKYSFGTTNGAYNRWAGEWTLAGSNNGTNWTLLHTPGTYYSANNHANRVANVTITLPSMIGTSYRYYRAIIQRVTNTSTSTRVSICNILYLIGNTSVSY